MTYKLCVVYEEHEWYISKTLGNRIIEGSVSSKHVNNTSNLSIYINNIHKNCIRLNAHLVTNRLMSMLSIQVGSWYR
jgi:hypothetical protein